MRKAKDRVRHAIGFEVIGLLIAVPLGSWAFDFAVHSIGVVAVVSSAVAAIWNYVFNWMFDHVMLRLRGTVGKTVAIRVGHAVLFEAGLLILLLPFIAWYLGITLWAAFVMDLAIAAFFLVYAFVYNWAYDLVFPVPETGAAR